MICRNHQLKNMITYLCMLGEVSRSGYYAWKKNEVNRSVRQINDEADIVLIKKIYDTEKGKVGALQIKLILDNDYHIIMNHKKIRRLMKKYNLIARIRRANPYKLMMKATQEHQTCKNLLKREFDQGEPGKVLLTDITYLYYGKGQKAYLSYVKDGATREIVAHVVTTSLKMNIVYRTLKQLSDAVDEFHPEALIHSDQGFHYTHPEFQSKVKKNGIGTIDVSTRELLGQCFNGIIFWDFQRLGRS